MLHHLLDGLTSMGSGDAILYLVGGALIGVIFGVIPGLSGAVILSIALSFVYHLNTVGVLALFLGIHAGSYYSASISAILLNTPPHPEAFAITFDGYPMAARGEPGRALGLSATATCIGGLIGCAVLVGFIPIINNLNVIFHAPEYVVLILIALILVATLGTDAVSKALISAGIGIMLASVGTSAVTGLNRFTFGSVELTGGISLVGLALGCFVVPQMILVFGMATAVAPQDMTGREIADAKPVELQRGFRRQVFFGMLEATRHWPVLLRSALIGVVTGIIPGIGGFAANFMSYGVSKQFSKRRDEFGTGVPEGIIAPEGSSLSKEAGGLIPLLGLGIPGSVGGALFLAALTIKGLRTGFGFVSSYPTITYQMVWVIALSGILGTLVGALSAPLLARVTKVRGPMLLPFVFSLAVVGAFVSDLEFFTVIELLTFAFVGFALRRLRYSLAAFAIGLVLGPTLESNIFLTRQVYPGASFLVKRPLADALAVVAIGLLVLQGIQLRRDKLAVGRNARRGPGRYATLGLVTTVLILAVSAWVALYAVLRYDTQTGIMPVAGAIVAGVAALWRLPGDARRFLLSRSQDTSEAASLAEGAPAPVVTVAGRALAATGLSARGSSSGGGVLTQPETVTGSPGGDDEPSGVTGEPPVTPGDGETGVPEDREAGLPVIKPRSWGRHGQYGRELVGFAWLIGLVAASYLVGFKVAVPVFCAAYGLSATRRILPAIRSRVIFAGASALAMWLMTYVILSLLHASYNGVL